MISRYDNVRLRACPFCGFIPDPTHNDCISSMGFDKQVWNITCYSSKGGCGTLVPGWSPKEAIEKWNTRK